MKYTLLKKIYYSLPPFLRKLAQKLYSIRQFIPYTKEYKRIKWIEKYSNFAMKQREYIFLSIARYCNINRPIEGYYFEFGCYGANTMRMAWDNFHHLFDWDYIAFDSFEGLPEIPNIDHQAIWEKGKLRMEEEEFIHIMTSHGMPKEKLITIKGFYENTLNHELKSNLLPKKASVVYIDCDLYSSTVSVLTFIKNFLQNGTIVVFDDWNCFHGDPEKGERRAFNEFLKRNSELHFEEFVKTNEAMSFIFIEKNENNKG